MLHAVRTTLQYIERYILFCAEESALLYKEKLSEQASIKVILTYMIKDAANQRISITALIT
jgi:hypothetical protein